MSDQLTALFSIWTTVLGATVHGLSSTMSKCPACGRGKVGRKDFEHATADLFDGPLYPDWVGGLEVIVSQRVIEDCCSANLSGMIGHPIPVSADQCSQLKGKPIPRYFLLEVTGRVNLDRQLYDEYEGNVCEVCGFWSAKKGGKYSLGDKLELPELTTWDGSDFVRSRNIPLTYLYCSRAVVDLARIKKWSGFGIRAFTGTGRIEIAHTEADWFERFEASAKVLYPKSFNHPPES